jgi:nicotinate-nucleotide adenylyltransferase
LTALKVAIFGGTFDPIHLAHLIAAREAADQFQLERVLFVTSGNPPHKLAGATTPYEHRHRMVELASKADPRFEASRLEEGGRKSYSYETIRRVRSTLPAGDELYFIIGADAFAEIGSWYKSEEVLRMVDFIVVARPGYQYPVPPGARVHRLETLALPVSSSEIRRKLEAGEAPAELPPPVLDYVASHGLYRSA